MNGIVNRVLENVTAVLFPARCAGCQSLLAPGRAWCSGCWTALASAAARPYCPTCGANLGPHQELDSESRCPGCKKPKKSKNGKPEKIPLPWERICRLGVYESSLSRAIIHFKYHHGIQVGNLLGDMVGQVLKEQEWVDSVQALCPVPIHWTRRMTRGFNQAQVLAERISPIAGLPVLTLLRRVRPTVKQVGLSAKARMENLEGAFEVKENWPLEGTSLCLIDDVMTTGSTLLEAARTLRRAGVIKVYAVVLAKADQTG
jgi:ComF family protein